MKKRIVLLPIFCLLFSLLLTACGSEASYDGAMTPIKDESGTVTGYERKYHNDSGDITRWDVYDADEQYDHYILYEYDSSGRLGKETYYQANGIGVYYYAYSYSDEGTIAEMDYVNAKEGSARTLYDVNGIEQYRYTYDNNDDLVQYEILENDAWVQKELPTETDGEEDE